MSGGLDRLEASLNSLENRIESRFNSLGSRINQLLHPMFIGWATIIASVIGAIIATPLAR